MENINYKSQHESLGKNYTRKLKKREKKAPCKIQKRSKAIYEHEACYQLKQHQRKKDAGRMTVAIKP